MNISEHIPLAPYTTFKIGGPARFFCIVKNDADVIEAVAFAKEKEIPFFVLGGGSNLLISDDGYTGLVIKIEIGGIVVEEKGNAGLFKVGAGVDWDQFVGDVVSKGYYGVENLSSIPGVVGAVPVQNIGAYGTDASSVVKNVHAFDTVAGVFVDISNTDCQFEYRGSFFKKQKGRFIITRVDIELRKNAVVDASYKDLRNYFDEKNIANPTLLQVRDAVIDIRSAKLPDWKKWGTAGSFFKNPIVSATQFMILKKAHPDLPGFPEQDGRVKVSLGWILDKVCNAKGLVVGNAGTYEKQALVLVSKPGATAGEVVSLSRELMKIVKEKTGIEIEAEVEWVN